MSDLIYDNSGQIVDYLAQGLDLEVKELQSGKAFAITFAGRLVGGIIYSDCRPNDMGWINIYTTDKHWCSAKCLRQIFGIGFEVLRFRRINALIRADNHASLSLVQRCGFVKEGELRQYYSDGCSAVVWGMLRNDCKFLKKGETQNVKRIKSSGQSFGSR